MPAADLTESPSMRGAGIIKSGGRGKERKKERERLRHNERLLRNTRARCVLRYESGGGLR